MGPLGYPGPPPFVDEEWPPRAWIGPAAAPVAPPGIDDGSGAGAQAAIAAPDVFPPPEWLAPPPTRPPPPGVEIQPATPSEPPAPVAGSKNGPAPSTSPTPAPAGSKNAPRDPYVDAQAELADQRTQAIDQDTAAKTAEADFRARRGTEAAAMTQLQLRQAERDNEDARKFGQLRTRQLTDEIEAAGNTKLDRNRIWHNANTGQRLAIAASLFLGGMQSAFTGRNAALEAYNRILDGDFEAQQASLANRKDALQAKRGILADELAQGRDAYEARVKHTLLGYDLALKGIDAEAAKWQSPQMQAKAAQMKAEVQEAAMGKVQEFQRYQEEKAFREQQARNQTAIGWYNAKTGRMGADAQADRDRDEADARRRAELARAEGREFPIYGNGGIKAGPVGYAKDKESAGKAEVMLQAQGELRDLYEEGRRLFADDYAFKSSKRRTEQDAWNTKWKNANFRAATGRTDAPSAGEIDAFAIDTGAMFGEHRDRLDASYNTARTGVPGRLRSLGVDDATLEAQGIIDPPEAPTPGVTTPVVYYDEKAKTFNRDGRGTPLSPEQSARVMNDPNYAVEQRGGAGGIWYDKKLGYNTQGHGEKLSPSAEAQVRAQPGKFPINRGP